MKKQDPISINGIVVAAVWTPEGDVTEVDIAGYDEKRYRVVGDRIGGQLRDHVKKSVVVDGVVKRLKGGLVITVKQFRINDPNTRKSKVSKTAVTHL